MSDKLEFVVVFKVFKPNDKLKFVGQWGTDIAKLTLEMGNPRAGGRGDSGCDFYWLVAARSECRSYRPHYRRATARAF
ncbi:MAG: hypothetical protein QOD75_2209 [Blastocatellia bacterium]|jgi:hypothetical protein|nr:hypothetical protein [Blastocatellia bacterium]